MFYPIIFLLYYMFCCCFCAGGNTESPHKSVMRKFTKFLHFKGNHNESLDNLMRLYARDPDAIQALESCRLNPDFTEAIRNDVEFYIPQLCSFYLSKECTDEEAENLCKFIIMACKTEFFFSHRVMFFLNTFSDNTDPSIKS